MGGWHHRALQERMRGGSAFTCWYRDNQLSFKPLNCLNNVYEVMRKNYYVHIAHFFSVLLFTIAQLSYASYVLTEADLMELFLSRH